MTSLGYFIFISTIVFLIALLVFVVYSLINQFSYEHKIGGLINQKKYIILFSILTIIFISFLINPLTETYILKKGANIENYEQQILELTNTCNDIKLQLKNKPEKEIKKNLKTNLKNKAKELKNTKKIVIKESRNNFYYTKHFSIFIVICIIDFIITSIYFFFYILATIDFNKYIKSCQERIISMSDFIANKIGSCQPIDEAVNFFDQYTAQMEKFDKELSDAEDNVSSICSERVLFNFGRADRLRNAEEDVSKKRKEISKYKIKNKTNLENVQKLLKSIGDEDGSFYKDFQEDIKNAVNTILDEKQKEEQEKKEKENLYIEETNRKAKENLRNEAKIRDKNLAEQQKKESVCYAINELKSFIPVLQNHISENKKIDFRNLSILEKHLDTIEDLKNYIPEDYINDIERCQIKLNAAFNSCENKDDLQIKTSIQLILEIFEKILNKE